MISFLKYRGIEVRKIESESGKIYYAVMLPCLKPTFKNKRYAKKYIKLLEKGRK